MTRFPIPRVVVAGLMLIAVVFVVGSGAFNTISTDRTATITTAGDASALLGIEQHPSASGDFTFGSGATFSFAVSPSANTTYDKVLKITNQGSQSVAVWIVTHDYSSGSGSQDLSGDIVGQDANNTGAITFFNQSFGPTCENGVPSVEGQTNAVQVDAGESLVVGIQANTNDVDPDEADILDEITIHADANVNGVSTTLNTQC